MMDNVDFTDDWHRFFRSSTSRKSTEIANITPQSITSLLSSTLFVLQSYDVHPIIIIQAMAQFFHFISCELFNRILTNKKLLCRSKAMQIRLNFSHLEDWISVNKLPTNLQSYLNPSIQLLQLLQCLSQLGDLLDFIHVTKGFDQLNATQVKRCVVNYRYEVNEQRIPEEIEKYAMQCAQDIVRNINHRKSIALSRSASKKSTLSAAAAAAAAAASIPSTPISENLPALEPEEQSEEDQDEEENDDSNIKETKDAKFMLPFSIPTTTHMVFSSSLNHWDNKTDIQQQQQQQRQIVPIIPEEWMDKLDKPSLSSS
jgi:hypothetical protein